MDGTGSPRDRRNPGGLGPDQPLQTLVHHPIEGRPQGGVVAPQTAGLQQLQRRLLLGLKPQQTGTVGHEQSPDLVKGLAQGWIGGQIDQADGYQGHLTAH